VLVIGCDQALEHRDLTADSVTAFRLPDVSRLRQLLDLLHRWLNQVAISCSIIQRKLLTPNDFADLEALRLRLALDEELSNQNPTPFQWKFDRTKLTALFAKIEARHRVFADAQPNCLKEAA